MPYEKDLSMIQSTSIVSLPLQSLSLTLSSSPSSSLPLSLSISPSLLPLSISLTLFPSGSLKTYTQTIKNDPPQKENPQGRRSTKENLSKKKITESTKLTKK